MPAPAQTQKKPKPKAIIPKLASPYTAPVWPTIDASAIEEIVTSLCALVSPIGAHRRSITPSKGRHAHKTTNTSSTPDSTPSIAPEVSKHILVGLNSVTRHLEALAALSNPLTKKSTNSSSTTIPATAKREETGEEASGGGGGGGGGGGEKVEGEGEAGEGTVFSDTNKPEHLALLFVITKTTGANGVAATPSLIHEHLPLLAATASFAHAELPGTRIVSLPASSATKAEERIILALGVPRVGVLGVLESAARQDENGDAQARNLIAFIRGIIEPVDVPWLTEAKSWTTVKVT